MILVLDDGRDSDPCSSDGRDNDACSRSRLLASAACLAFALTSSDGFRFARSTAAVALARSRWSSLGLVNRDPCGNKLRAGTASGDETRPAGRFTRAMSLSDEYWDAGYEYSDTARDDAIGSVLAVGCDDRAVGCDEAASSFRRKPASNCSFAAA